MSRCILVVGGTHRGKSTFIKERIKGLPNFVNDIKGEYRGKANFKTWNNPGDREGFLDFVDTHLTHTQVVLEEASFYLSNRHYSSRAEQVIVNKWESGNTFYLVYHSIRKIPLMVYDYADAMILFKTKDLKHNISKHPPEVLRGYDIVKVQSRTNKNYNIYIELDDV